MVATLIVSGLTLGAVIVSSLTRFHINIKGHAFNFYWVFSLLGAIILLCSGLLPFDTFFKGLTSSNGINPLQIIVLFLSLSLMSIFLDELGFFSFLASKVASKAGNSQMKLFLFLFLLVSVLTMFTSNDIIILTLTPFIVFFCKRAKISPIPFLFAEFTSANTFSMMLVIGNPTNIYIASNYGIDFISYFKVMWLPTLLAGITELGILLLLFFKKLKEKINADSIDIPSIDKPMTYVGVGFILVCTVTLAISNYLNWPMYLICLIAFAAMIVVELILSFSLKENKKVFPSTFKRTPYELAPFLLGMFAIALALGHSGFLEKVSSFLGESNTLYVYGYSSFLSCNVLNNIPMSVVFSSIMYPLKGIALQKAVYGTIIGSNIGAFLTPLGALAGLMWTGILKKHEVDIRFIDFIKIGAIVSLPTLTVALLSVNVFCR